MDRTLSLGPESLRTLSRRLAAAVAVVGAVSCVSLGLFFAAGGPFGRVNDVGNGLLGLLCGALALTTHRSGRLAITALALGGAAGAVLGSYLVMRDITGYFLAGLVSAFGFALIGLWLVVATRSGDLPGRRSGQTAGAVMALGMVNLPAVVQGLDDQDSAPAWLLAVGICWAGTYLLLPAWSGRFALTSSGTVNRGRGRRSRQRRDGAPAPRRDRAW